MNSSSLYISDYNDNIYVSLLQYFQNRLADVQKFLIYIGRFGAYWQIDDLALLYENIFSDAALASHIEFSINKLLQSVYLRPPDEYSKSNTYFHLTLQMKSESVIWLDEIYERRLLKMLKFYKHLFSKIDNYYITLDQDQIRKYEFLLLEIRNDVAKFLEYIDYRDIIDKRKKLDEIHLSKIPFGGLFYITHIDNLQSILQHGILSHNSAHSQGFVKVDISNRGVNARRNRIEKSLGGNIHDFSPLYINPKNPMLYVLCKTSNKEDLILLRVNPHILLVDNVAFSDGNAAVSTTKFYKDINDFNKLNWKVIGAQYWTIHPDGKRMRCSEVLVQDRIPLYYICDILSYDETHFKSIFRLFPNHMGIRLNKNATLFF